MQTAKWKKIFANDTFNKALIVKIYEQLIQLNTFWKFFSGYKRAWSWLGRGRR